MDNIPLAYMRAHRLLLFILILFLIPATIPANASPNPDPTPELFSDASNRVPANIVKHRGDIRTRLVTVDFTLLETTPGVSLNLFADATYTALLDRKEATHFGGYAWNGHLKDVAYSSVNLVVENGIMAGSIMFPGGTYLIRSAGNGIHSINQVDQSAFASEAPPLIAASSTASTPAATRAANMTPNAGPTIDVMVLYTTDVKNAQGGPAQTQAFIDQAIAVTNQTYANSGINQRINLVHAEEVSYPESGDLETDLGRLRGTSDGFLDNIHAIRDSYGADMVSLIVQNSSGGVCGIAYLMTTVSTSFAPNAFSVVQSDCAVDNLSFPHELGHNMGATHDWYIDGSTQPYPYMHGYVNTAGKWRTVMAYNNECADSGFVCQRLPYWSNPDLLYLGDPMGVPEGSFHAADNRKVLNNTASTVAQFRVNLNLPEHIFVPVTLRAFSAGW